MKDFYQQSSKDVLERVQSNEQGLTENEAQKRLTDYGPNKLPVGKVDNYFIIFLRQFQSSLIYILLLACLIIFLMGEVVDSIIILIVLIFNALVGTIQEGKAQNTLLALKKITETKATVLRDGRELIVSDEEIVPGDILILQEGEKVSADARLIAVTNLKVDESTMTGESEPVQKIIDPLNQSGLTIADQNNMLFKGTNILAGSGRAVVVMTGVDTVIGKISKELSAIDAEMPLKTNIRNLSRLIILVVSLMSVILFLIGVFSGKSYREMFGTVISLAVSIIPEGLPIVITLVLATGVWRMSKRNALVKKLQAVEALGQARVIAVDKTGTITKNEMTVQKVYLASGQLFEIEGNGYEPKGGIHLLGNLIDPINHPELALMGRLSAFCSNARVLFSEAEKVWRVAGDPTEAAMLVFSQKLGFHKDSLEKENPVLAELPFDYKLKYHATVHQVDKDEVLAVVGAPEEILNRCQHLSDEIKNKLELVFQEMSKEGLRIIALAVKNNFTDILTDKFIDKLSFVGFLGMKDPLRSEVALAMADAHNAGMRVVMITGDHKITAQAIATEAGIYKKGDEVLSGTDVDNLSDKELSLKLAKVTVFARVTPEHKLRIINCYKTRGEIVAMTGDGVNDAPSLVAADLGVAMGKIGTEVAKEASDIVLLDDNFGSIIGAVEEGRNIYKTIKKVILYLFSTSWGEALTIMGAMILGFPLPLLPAQIIWLNFVTDGFLDVSLAMDPKESGLLQAKFDKPRKYILDKLMVQRMFSMAIPMVVGTLILFSFYIVDDLTKAWTISVTTLAVFQWFNAWNCRHESKSVFQMNPFSNKYLLGAMVIVIILQLCLVYNPIMQNLFKTTALTLSEWLMIILIASSILWVEEIRKFFYRLKLT
ncbi:MAG: HAD-IC family P-type ATPase [Candidatus Paceibacterota bacterium]